LQQQYRAYVPVEHLVEPVDKKSTLSPTTNMLAKQVFSFGLLLHAVVQLTVDAAVVTST